MEWQNVINIGLFAWLIIHSIRLYRLEKRMKGIKNEEDQ